MLPFGLARHMHAAMRYSQMVSGSFDYSLYGIANGSGPAVVLAALRPFAACLLDGA